MQPDRREKDTRAVQTTKFVILLFYLRQLSRYSQRLHRKISLGEARGFQRFSSFFIGDQTCRADGVGSVDEKICPTARFRRREQLPRSQIRQRDIIVSAGVSNG